MKSMHNNCEFMLPGDRRGKGNCMKRRALVKRGLAACLIAVMVFMWVLMSNPDLASAASYKSIALGTVSAKSWKTSSKIKAPTVTNVKVTRRANKTSIAKLTAKNEDFISNFGKQDMTIEDELSDSASYRSYTNSIDKTSAEDTCTVSMSWKKVSGAQGYEIRAKQSYAGYTDESWRYARTTSNNVKLTTYWKANGLGAYFWFATEASYKIQVRAYKKIGGTYYYGKWSGTTKITGDETVGDVIWLWDSYSIDRIFNCKLEIPNDADGVFAEYEFSNGQKENVTSTEIKNSLSGSVYCMVRIEEKADNPLRMVRAKAFKEKEDGTLIYSKNWYYVYGSASE